MKETTHQFSALFPETKVWGYDGLYPGPTIEAFKDIPTYVEWANELPEKHLLPVDKSLHGTMDTPEVKTVVHLHGARVADDSDGYPEAWYTPNYEITGPKFTRKVYVFYPDIAPIPEDVPVRPSIVPAFFGNTIFVNVTVWPYLKVEPRKYRFRILNASNRREYILRLSNGGEFVQIGTDGGLIPHPINIDSFNSIQITF